MEKSALIDVQHFVAVAQTGSFTAAASALGMTGSALSKSVMRLEARLGSKLLHRTTRRISLTAEGAAYFASCQHAMAILEEAEGCLQAEQQHPAGRIRIDMPVAFGRRYILPSLIKLSMQHERLDFSITFNERFVDLVNEGIDLAIRIGVLEDDADLVARRLGTQHLVICGAPTYFARHGVPLTKEDLSQHDCVVSWRRNQRHAWLLKGKRRQTEAYGITARHEVADGEALLSTALAGLGLIQVPTWLVDEHLATGALMSVLDEFRGGEMPIHVIWAKNNYLQPKLRVVIDALLEQRF